MKKWDRKKRYKISDKDITKKHNDKYIATERKITIVGVVEENRRFSQIRGISTKRGGAE